MGKGLTSSTRRGRRNANRPGLAGAGPRSHRRAIAVWLVLTGICTMGALSIKDGQFFAPLSFAALACLLPLWQRVVAALPMTALARADRNAELASELSTSDMEADELRERLWVHERTMAAFGDTLMERASDGVILSGNAIGTDGPAVPAPHEMDEDGCGTITDVNAGDGSRLAWLDLARADPSTGLMRHFAVARAVRRDEKLEAALTTIAHDVRAPVANITGLADWPG